ncbi:MAG TPA: DUF4386 domain-containing protein [Vicinamibacterales bacterium]|nr:DUF4386 domain-containing protein [Vicinamibacterales bacterium]
MTEQSNVSPQRLARTAGVLYLAIIVIGGFGYFSGSSLLVPGDAAATAGNILAAESTWRLAIAALLVMLVCDVALAVLLYVLFAPVSQTVALLSLAFRLVHTSIQAVAVLARVAPVLILRDLPAATAFSRDELQALSRVSLRLFEQGFDIGLLFFGVDCLAVGWLIHRSRFLPRALGVGMTIAGSCYLADVVSGLLFPLLDVGFDIMWPGYVSELALCLWLVGVGLDEAAWRARVATR